METLTQYSQEFAMSKTAITSPELVPWRSCEEIDFML